jgi:hypothetical protein
MLQFVAIAINAARKLRLSWGLSFCKRFTLRLGSLLHSRENLLKLHGLQDTKLGLQIAQASRIQKTLSSRQEQRARTLRRRDMAYKETFWMACDSIEQLRAEYGPFHTRSEAESEARKLGFHYVLRYEHLLDENEEIQEVRCVFIELPSSPIGPEVPQVSLHTRCATCGAAAVHAKTWQAEVWADIHEFENSRHLVRLFEHACGKGLKEIAGWRR